MSRVRVKIGQVEAGDRFVEHDADRRDSRVARGPASTSITSAVGAVLSAIALEVSRVVRRTGDNGQQSRPAAPERGNPADLPFVRG